MLGLHALAAQDFRHVVLTLAAQPRSPTYMRCRHRDCSPLACPTHSTWHLGLLVAASHCERLSHGAVYDLAARQVF